MKRENCSNEIKAKLFKKHIFQAEAAIHFLLTYTFQKIKNVSKKYKHM